MKDWNLATLEELARVAERAENAWAARHGHTNPYWDTLSSLEKAEAIRGLQKAMDYPIGTTATWRSVVQEAFRAEGFETPPLSSPT